MNKFDASMDIGGIKYPLMVVNPRYFLKLKKSLGGHVGLPSYIVIRKGKSPEVLPTPNGLYRIMVIDNEENTSYQYLIGEVL